jgi:hypothetical protein
MGFESLNSYAGEAGAFTNYAGTQGGGFTYDGGTDAQADCCEEVLHSRAADFLVAVRIRAMLGLV